MKKSLCFAFMFVVLAAFSAKAVVIHWAVTDMPAGTTSAQLVYVSSGTPSYTTPGSPPTPDAGGSNIGSYVNGLAVTPVGIGEQNSVDSAGRTMGNYYIVLFNDSNQYSYSTALAYNDTTYISDSELSPGDAFFDPASGDFSTWATVPEPGSAAMLALGVTLLALRRRRRS